MITEPSFRFNQIFQILQTFLLVSPSEHAFRRRRHRRPRWRLVLLLELIAHLLKRYPLHPFVFIDMLDNPFVHE